MHAHMLINHTLMRANGRSTSTMRPTIVTVLQRLWGTVTLVKTRKNTRLNTRLTLTSTSWLSGLLAKTCLSGVCRCRTIRRIPLALRPGGAEQFGDTQQVSPTAMGVMVVIVNYLCALRHLLQQHSCKSKPIDHQYICNIQQNKR